MVNGKSNEVIHTLIWLKTFPPFIYVYILKYKFKKHVFILVCALMNPFKKFNVL